MDVNSGMEKMSVGQRAVVREGKGGARGGGGGGGGGRAVVGVEEKPAVCLYCQQSCSGFRPHSWRKACMACGCSLIDHAPGGDSEDDQRMGRLLADSPCAHLTAKVKGAGGLRVYKRNRIVVTNPVVSRKDPTFNTTTYDWAPPGLTQKLAMQYMELLSEERRPVSGTVGSLYRRRLLLDQLPVYDQDPMQCQGLAGEEQITAMILFVKKYKEEVLGVGEVALPGEGGTLLEASNQRKAKEAKDHGSTNSKAGREHQDHGAPNHKEASAASSTNGIDNGTKTEHQCTGCGGAVTQESPAVFAERAGYHGALWHPACFVCSVCGQGLVDLVYFWSNEKLFCGRHYCQSVRPRCAGCDELIFSESLRTGTDGQTWHNEHYCCWTCGQSLEQPCGCAHS